MLERLFWTSASSFLANTQPQKEWILYLPSRTLGGTPFTGPRPLYATGITNNAQGGGASTTLTNHLDLLCEPSTMLFFFSPSSPPSQHLLLHSTPRSLCHEVFAAPLQHPHSTLNYFILTHCKSRLSCLYPNTSCHCATPFTPLHLQVWGKTHSAAPFTHPTHARIIFTHYCPTILSLCHFSAVFLPSTFQIPHPQKCDQLFSHSPPTHLARQYTLPTLRGPLPQAYLC